MHELDYVQSVVETLPAFIWAMSPHGQLLYCNRRALRLLEGSGAHRPPANLLSLVMPQDRRAAMASWKAVKLHATIQDMECRVQSRPAIWRWLRIQLAPWYDDHGKLLGWFGCAADIDDIKRTNAELSSAVKARDLLLREANHHVKNALQVVAGILTIQANKITNVQDRRQVLEAREQVVNIAKVFGLMTQSRQLGRIELGALLNDVVSGLTEPSHGQQPAVQLDVDCSLMLPLDRGVALALAVSEIVANLREDRGDTEVKPRIGITVRKEHAWAVMEICGSGDEDVRAGVRSDRPSALGMDIVRALVEQATGKIEMLGSSGVRIRLLTEGDQPGSSDWQRQREN